jgi:hypothetical protein
LSRVAQLRPRTERAYRIESGVPMPRNGGHRWSSCPYPFLDLPLRHSFFVPVEPGDTQARLFKRLRGWADRLPKYHPEQPLRFSVWRRVEEGVTGVRVWRTR